MALTVDLIAITGLPVLYSGFTSLEHEKPFRAVLKLHVNDLVLKRQFMLSPASEASSEVENLTERKICMPMHMVSKILSVCLPSFNVLAVPLVNHLSIGRASRQLTKKKHKNTIA